MAVWAGTMSSRKFGRSFEKEETRRFEREFSSGLQQDATRAREAVVGGKKGERGGEAVPYFRRRYR